MARAENHGMHKGNHSEQVQHASLLFESEEIYSDDVNMDLEDAIIQSDDIGNYVELCFTTDMAPIILDGAQYLSVTAEDVATLRVYISENTR